MRTAIYPGTFDPITYGHIDVIKKSLKLVDRVVVGTTENINKDYFFSIEERVSIIRNSLFKDLRLKSLEKLLELDFDGYALGGLAVGENQNEMFKILN